MMLRKNNLKQIITEYYETIKCLLKYENSEETKSLCKAVLRQIVICSQRIDLYDQCLELIDNADAIKTIGDAVVLDLEEHCALEERLVLEIKANLLTTEKIKSLQTFDQETFIEELITKASEGNINACKLYAMMNCLGLMVNKDLNVAKIIYQMLSYTGDYYAMLFLVATCNELKNKKDVTIWKQVIELYLKHNSRFILVLDDELSKDYPKEVNDIVQIILCNKNRIISKRNEGLEIIFLYYLVITKQKLEEILSNICNYKVEGYELILREKHFNNKKYGF